LGSTSRRLLFFFSSRRRHTRWPRDWSSDVCSSDLLAASKPGVEKVYALQAGREIRVIVAPGDVDDDAAALLSHEIAREIEDQLEYPGQVKVTVIRESRSVDVARNHTAVQNGDERSDGDGSGAHPLLEDTPASKHV